MNHVHLVGRFTRNPELRYTESAKAVCNFSIAINSGFGEKKTTEYVDCVAWEATAEKVAEYGRTGREIAVIGRIQTRSWEDKNTGEKRKKTEVVASQAVVSAAEPKGQGAPDAAPPRRPAPRPDPEVEIDDIPF